MRMRARAHARAAAPLRFLGGKKRASENNLCAYSDARALCESFSQKDVYHSFVHPSTFWHFCRRIVKTTTKRRSDRRHAESGRERCGKTAAGIEDGGRRRRFAGVARISAASLLSISLPLRRRTALPLPSNACCRRFYRQHACTSLPPSPRAIVRTAWRGSAS